MISLQAYAIWQNEKNNLRNQNPLRLGQFGYKSFSKNDEDGIIQEIFHRIGTKRKTFIEFGVSHGLECNTAALLIQGWSGLWIEGDSDLCERMRATHRSMLKSDRLKLVNNFINRENINDLLSKNYSGADLDLLSIDIDFNDYWVWEAIDCVHPRVVIVEYNASWPPPASITVPYRADGNWNLTNYFGASLGALSSLAEKKGYKLVGCCLAGVNAFFVRTDLVKDKFFAPGNIREHYEPPRYFLSSLPAGHPPMLDSVIEV